MMKNITLCGSSRFEPEWKTCLRLLTMNGVIATGQSSYPSELGDDHVLGAADKEVVDLVHMCKVARADSILVIDCSFEPSFDENEEVRSYVGVSTARELLWAAMQAKPVVFLSSLISKDGPSIEEAMAEVVKAVPGFEMQVLELDVARVLIERALGRTTVAEDQRTTHFNVMHASLSDLTRSEDPQGLGEQALATLSFIGLEPMPDAPRDAYLELIGKAGSGRSVIGA